MSRGDVILSVDDVGKTYESGARSVEAIRSLTFEVREGDFCSIVGPSGCGKTTLLKMLSGLMPLTHGVARLNGHIVTEPPSNLALVFQDYSRSLLPWLTVAKNVRLPLRAKGIGSVEQARIAQEALEAVGLPQAGDLHPWQLSGGMQQRVAIARALAYQSEILLMDEPFASVDAQTRADLEDLVLDVWGRYGVTILFVTHDIDEAVYLSDRVIVLTPSPTSVKEVIDIRLPRPRDQVVTKETSDFTHLRSRIYKLVKRPDETIAQELPTGLDAAAGRVR